MWYAWLARYYEMGALAAVSTLHQNPLLDHEPCDSSAPTLVSPHFLHTCRNCFLYKLVCKTLTCDSAKHWVNIAQWYRNSLPLAKQSGFKSMRHTFDIIIIANLATMESLDEAVMSESRHKFRDFWSPSGAGGFEEPTCSSFGCLKVSMFQRIHGNEQIALMRVAGVAAIQVSTSW